jgi:hypothetical protein
MTSVLTADFESEFLHNLESFVRNPIQIEPVESWDPRQTAAPERHYMLGLVAHKSVDSQVYMLRDNYAFQDIESILHISFHAVDYAECTVVHPVKEQVWLFGYTWLEKYLAFLAKPGAMKKEFYRRHNDRFLEVLGGFLVYNPTERMSFYDALRFWNPQHILLGEPGGAPSASSRSRSCSRSCSRSVSAVAASVSTADAVQPTAQLVATSGVNTVDHSSPVQPLESTAYHGVRHPEEVVTAAASAPGGRRRLNLVRLYDSAGRTKTRKACNSAHYPASDNRD